MVGVWWLLMLNWSWFEVEIHLLYPPKIGKHPQCGSQTYLKNIKNTSNIAAMKSGLFRNISKRNQELLQILSGLRTGAESQPFVLIIPVSIFFWVAYGCVAWQTVFNNLPRDVPSLRRGCQLQVVTDSTDHVPREFLWGFCFSSCSVPLSLLSGGSGKRMKKMYDHQNKLAEPDVFPSVVPRFSTSFPGFISLRIGSVTKWCPDPHFMMAIFQH